MALPIWCDGQRVGHITSGAFAHTLGRSLGFGYVTSSEPVTRKAMREGAFKIEIADKMFNASCLLRAPYDPDNARILC